MKKYVFIALFFTAFMFPFFGSITNADALGNYGCGNPDRKTHVNCLRGLLDTTPYGLTVPKGPIGLGQYGCGKKAGNIKKRQHVNCLRRLLDEHGTHLQVGNNGGGEHHDPNMPPPGGGHHDPCMPPPGGGHHDPNMPPPGGPGDGNGNHPPAGNP
jgi:hypothetical protein